MNPDQKRSRLPVVVAGVAVALGGVLALGIPSLDSREAEAQRLADHIVNLQRAHCKEKECNISAEEFNVLVEEALTVEQSAGEARNAEVKDPGVVNEERHCSNGGYFCFFGTVCNPQTHRCEKAEARISVPPAEQKLASLVVQ